MTSRILFINLFFAWCVVAGCSPLYAQSGTGSIAGTVRSKTDGETIPFAHIMLEPSGRSAVSDTTGNFSINGLKPGAYELRVSMVGFDQAVVRGIGVTAGLVKPVGVRLQPSVLMLDEIVVKTEPFKEGIEVPAGLYSLVSAEIRRNPGSDNDISKVMRSLPGVATMSSFRNDLIIRGGGPNENRFFLDEIEIPVINHLVTQGASGGAYSLLNSNLLREVDYLSSSFPASRGNALSSVYQFTLRDGRPDSTMFTASMGGTDAGVILETRAGERTGILFSARRSYRQNILKLLKFAFIPVYNDMVAKVSIRIKPNMSLTFLGIGAIDDFKLNSNVGNNEVQRYLFDNLPASQQSNYTTGVVFRAFSGNRTLTFAASRSQLDNRAEKYAGNQTGDEANLLLRYNSTEATNRGRLEVTTGTDRLRFLAGASLEENMGTYSVFSRTFNRFGPVNVGYDSDIRFLQYGVFAQLSASVFGDKLGIVAGVRSDGSDYNRSMLDLREQVGARLGLTWNVSGQVTANAGIADYYQLPPMMTLSYRNSGELDNLNTARYVRSRHYVGGIKWTNRTGGRLSVEGFYKSYPRYLMSLRDSISVAHLPVDFGVFGNYPVSYGSAGRAYGVELFYQQRLFHGFYGMAAYTLSRSEYKDKSGLYRPATWDARHISNVTLGKRINSRWEVGLSWRMQSALPYTPFNQVLSALKQVWDVNNQGIRDYSKLNTARGKATNLINLRVDRVWRFPGWTLNVYMDIENLLADADSQQVMLLERTQGGTGEPLIDNPSDPETLQRYRVRQIANAQGALIPTFGTILKF